MSAELRMVTCTPKAIDPTPYKMLEDRVSGGRFAVESWLTRNFPRATKAPHRHLQKGFVPSSANFPRSRTKRGWRPFVRGEQDMPRASAPSVASLPYFRDWRRYTRRRGCR